jgi:hypothetical protein
METVRLDYIEAVEVIDRARQEIQSADERMTALLDIAAGIEALFPDLEVDLPARREERPRGQAAVRAILVDFPGRGFTVADMVKALGDRGWLPESESPGGPTRTALDRLVAAEPAFKKAYNQSSHIVYFYDAPTGGEEPF